MGGSNQSLFLLAALFVGQAEIPGQGSAAVPLLIVGVMLSWAAAPAWTELVLMWPNRVGGISAACAEAFRPYSPVLSAITGVCYWWGWVPTCGLTALLSAAAIQQWFVPGLPVEAVAVAIVIAFAIVNLCGIKWVSRCAIPIATASALLALLSALVPIFSGHVDWHEAFTFKLSTPFPGWFGDLTSAMAGLYLIGFAAPAFEAATCHVGETKDPNRNIPRAVFASAAMAGVYFIALPLVWLGTLGPIPLGRDLAVELGPTFAPLFGALAKSAAIWFVMLNMFHGTLQPLAGASRTLAQLSEDGLLPRFLSLRNQTDCPWAATVLTATFAIIFLIAGDPVWVIAAANFTYLISICMPNVAAWLLRRDMPEVDRPYRAPKYMVGVGLLASGVWLCAAILGFQQFGLPTVVFGLMLAYSGAAMFAWRLLEDSQSASRPSLWNSLHLKLTGSMLLVLFLDSAGYLLAIYNVPASESGLVSALEDIFVVVALLSISVGLVLPGMITHSASEVNQAARHLANHTMRDFSRAMAALGRGDFSGAPATVTLNPVAVHSRDELGLMAQSFNDLQAEIEKAAVDLTQARDKLREATETIAAKHQENAHLAHHDPLTDLPNRHVLGLRMQLALANCSARQQVALLFLDLDDFKSINDTLGHAAGDKLLQIVGKRLRKGVKKDDAVARLGGDEFAIILVGADIRQRAEQVAKRIISILREPIRIGRKSVVCSCSIGLATAPEQAIEATDLFRFADLALYAAKEVSGSSYCFFTSAMERQIQERCALERELRDAIDGDQLEVHYQPVLSIARQEVMYAEALVRWRHPDRGLIHPDVFVPLAEATGLIVDLGAYVLRKACRDASLWPDDIGVAVNISAQEIKDATIIKTINNALADSNLRPQRLQIEITESMTISNVDRTSAVLKQIAGLGVEIAIDDFGTGYSSLSSLRAFPFTRLKIDRSFVSDLESSAQACAVLESIVRLAGALGMRTTAEGVETVDQLHIVREYGCDDVQGYLFHRPMTIDVFNNLLAEIHRPSETAA